jgi:UDP-3-O-[3-hydroxymyristoyl] glucosamine N-acyltransferase
VIGSIVGERATIGADSQVHGLAVVGPGAEVGEGNMLDHGVRIAADVTIPPGALTFS